MTAAFPACRPSMRASASPSPALPPRPTRPSSSDEIAADGTSGPFTLASAPLVRNSEKIVVETRDRFRPDIILGSVPLVRYADYDIDFETGEIIFRLPVPAADAAFNPTVIVVDYETAAPTDRNLTAGGRGAVRFLAGRGELGATYVHEEAPGVSGENVDLAGADLRLDLTDKDSASRRICDEPSRRPGGE